MLFEGVSVDCSFTSTTISFSQTQLSPSLHNSFLLHMVSFFIAVIGLACMVYYAEKSNF